jgi:AcrR family transcriptional regulator
VGSTGLALVGTENQQGVATRRLGADDGSTPQRIRLADAALVCIARYGIAKTTLDDVARAAGCSRATVYRVFPGGKDGLVAAVVDTEVARFFSALALRMGGASNLEDVLVVGMNEAAVRITEHPALSFLLDNEPEVILPHLTFSHMDNLLGVSSTFTAPFLGRFLDHEEAKRVAEWAARIVLSHLLCPADGVDLTDEARVRRLVRTFVLPGDRPEVEFEEAVRPGGVERIDRAPRSTRTLKGETS